MTFGDRWLLLTGEERTLINRLYGRSKRLDHPDITSDIFQGVKTGADQVYKLTKLGPNKYRCNPDDSIAYEVEIGDGVMHPILSGF